jgi:hypothetical protein
MSGLIVGSTELKPAGERTVPLDSEVAPSVACDMQSSNLRGILDARGRPTLGDGCLMKRSETPCDAGDVPAGRCRSAAAAHSERGVRSLARSGAAALGPRT